MKKILVLILFCSIGWGCSDDNGTEPTIKKGNIKGIVVDYYSYLPIEGAFITTIPISSSVKTESDGTFEIKSVVEEDYNLSVRKSGYHELYKPIKITGSLINELVLPLIPDSIDISDIESPILYYPPHGSKIQSKEVEFLWEYPNNSSSSLLFDLYFGEKKSNLYKLDSNIVNMNTKIAFNFEEGVTYYWKIVAKEGVKSANSEIFQFTYEKSDIDIDLTDLVGNWKLDNNALDSSPNNLHGIEKGVIYIQDRDGNDKKAAKFNGFPGESSKVLLPASIHLEDKFTISYWINQSTSLGENSTVGNFDCVSQWGGSGKELASINSGVNFQGLIFFSTYSKTGEKKHNITNIVINPNRWYHLCFVYVNGSVTFYINGEEKLTEDGYPTPQVSKLNFSIGGRQDQLSSFHGAIDDVYIFSRALNNTEISKLAE